MTDEQKQSSTYNMLVEAHAVIEWMVSALNGDPVSEFAQSFPAAALAVKTKEALEATQGRLREAVGLIDKFMLQGHAPQLYPGNRDPEYGIDEDPAWVCHGCGEWGEEPTSIDHSDTCPFESARRFLAGTPGGE